MIIPDKKKTVSIILSKMKKDGSQTSAPVHNEKEMGEPSDLHLVAEDMMLALKNGSISGLESALEAFKSLLESEDEEEDSEEGPSEPLESEQE